MKLGKEVEYPESRFSAVLLAAAKSKRLKKYLSDSELAKPTHRVVVVEAEVVHESFVAEQAEGPASDGIAVTAEGPSVLVAHPL